MTRHRILVAWVGHSDLRAFAAKSHAALQKEVLALVKGDLPPPGERGPIGTLLDREPFDEVVLLSTYPGELTMHYGRWLGRPVDTLLVKLPKPTDHAAIYEAADGLLRKIRERKDWPQIELCLHLSPGTPAMAAVWLLLGKTRYPATFYETYQGNSWVTNVPFDLTLDVLPEILRDADSRLAHVVAKSPGDLFGFEDIVGESQAIRLAVGRAHRAALRGVSVLLLGESGTGKVLFAQAIHRASPRREKPLVPINCAAVPAQLLESELFGHKKGAFTGADRDRAGAFQAADGGTLFLDEIGECDLDLQAKLLRVLEPPDAANPCTRRFRAVGSDRDSTADVRIIAATNRDLHEAIGQRLFREDLFYRLAAVTIHIPPLRDRCADMPRIAERLLARINDQFRAEGTAYEDKSLSDTAIAFVKRHDWPGNIRQLFNVLVQAAVMTEGNSIDRDDLIGALGEAAESSPTDDIRNRPLGDGFKLEDVLNELHRHYLRRAMSEANGVKLRAAQLLGIDNHQTFTAQLKRLKVDVE